MWLQAKYVALISTRLDQFKQKGSHLWNFRDPLCGDSQKSKYKARGYIYQRSGELWFSCHNCGVNLPFPKFLKTLDKSLYEAYLMDRLVENRPDTLVQKAARKEIDFRVDMEPAERNKPLQGLLRLDKLAESKVPPGAINCLQYVEGRKIPLKWYSSLYYIENFYEWTNAQIPGKYDEELYSRDEPRLLIPGFDRDGGLSMWQSRILGPGEGRLRYLTAVLPMSPKLWGLNHINFDKRFFALEGPIDAMYLSNALATCGGKISSELMKVGASLDNCVRVYDNEPRNVDVVKNLWKDVRAGYNVVIWDPSLPSKDVGRMVEIGWKPEEVDRLLDNLTTSGLDAEGKFYEWNKSGWTP
jgi:hypothetical protein